MYAAASLSLTAEPSARLPRRRYRESLYEDDSFPKRELAALLASKVFYHLGELDDSLQYALGAGSLFNIRDESEYVQTLVAKCIDEYMSLRVKAVDAPDGGPAIDKRLVIIVEKMFDRCLAEQQYHQAVGMAVESRRLDQLEEAINRSDDMASTLAYALTVCQTLVDNRGFMMKMLRVLERAFERCPSPDYVNMCRCLMFLDDAPGVAAVLHKLVKQGKDGVLLAYQIGFDLFENELQHFLNRVRQQLDVLQPLRVAGSSGNSAAAGAVAAPPADSAAAAPAVVPPPAARDAVAMDTDEGNEGDAGAPAPGMDRAAAGGADASSTGDSSNSGAGGSLSPEVKEELEHLGRLDGILSGEVPIQRHLEFLYSRNRADLAVLKHMKQCVEVRNSVCHGATIVSNALMHASTTVDTFLRENLDWLSRATNWAKFTATAGLGVIHRGHLSQGRALMAPYLPQNGVSGSPYSEGGALYALGLIHANHGQGITPFLRESLRGTSNETIQHGAALGLGLAALGTEAEDVYEDLKGVLYTDSAVAGEAAGIGMGLLLAGTASEKAAEMLAYAHDTQHEKIIRGLVLGCALVMFGREEEADTLVEQMTGDADPIIRYGGMLALALAYCATASNAAIRRLLHFAVSDVNDNVRRAAVLSLGFVLCSQPEQCPKIVSLLAESYNPHVRYGAALAVGISCASTGLKEAIALLEPLTQDPVDFVRQGGLIAMAMVLVQATEPREPKVAAFRKQLDKVIADKHEETMSKMGAILAYGILDAGGRNVAISLRAPSGHHRLTAVIGLAVFAQYWFWYPLVYFVSLAFAPTALIGLNAELKVPKFEVLCKARPSLFGYPPPVTPAAATATSKTPAAVLSTTARSSAKAAAKKEAESAAEGKKVAAAAGKDGKKGAAGAAGGADKDKDKDAVKGPEKKAPEPASEMLANPSRVLPEQEKYVSWEGCRYQPVQPGRVAGIVILRDERPGEPEEFVVASTPANNAAAPAGGGAVAAGAAAAAPAATDTAMNEPEPPPPEPFEYTP
eukprot:jgi/Mesvir1/23827/Mv10633-RA.2